MTDDIAAMICAREVAGMIEPLDMTTVFSDAVVVCVPLRSLSVKFIVPDKLCSAFEPVVFAFSPKLPVALDDVMLGL